MIGGTVIENKITTLRDNGEAVRRLWCVNRHSGDECAVYADVDEAAEIQPGDAIWWQGGKIYWTPIAPDGSVICEDLELRKIGFSFDPRELVAAA